MIVTFEVDERFTVGKLDMMLHIAYLSKSQVEFVFNLTRSKITDVAHVIQAKPVLEKYRPLTRKYLKKTTIVVGNKLMKCIIKTALVILKPEKPVKVRLNT